MHVCLKLEGEYEDMVRRTELRMSRTNQKKIVVNLPAVYRRGMYKAYQIPKMFNGLDYDIHLECVESIQRTDGNTIARVICSLSGRPASPYYIGTREVGPTQFAHAYFNVGFSYSIIGIRLEWPSEKLTIARFGMEEHDDVVAITREVLWSTTLQVPLSGHLKKFELAVSKAKEKVLNPNSTVPVYVLQS